MANTVLVQIHLPKGLVEELDRLIAQGYYKSRAEVIEDAIRHFLREWHTSSEASKVASLYLSGKLPRLHEVDPLTIVVDPKLTRRRLLEEFGTDEVEKVIRTVRRKH